MEFLPGSSCNNNRKHEYGLYYLSDTFTSTLYVLLKSSQWQSEVSAIIFPIFQTEIMARFKYHVHGHKLLRERSRIQTQRIWLQGLHI